MLNTISCASDKANTAKLENKLNFCYIVNGEVGKMRLLITKGARQFGYVIWNKKLNSEMNQIIGDRDSVTVNFNGFNLGSKKVDRKYYRISLGYKLTRALPENHNYYSLKMENNILEVQSLHAE